MKNLSMMICTLAIGIVVAFSNGCSSTSSNAAPGADAKNPAAPTPTENPSAHIPMVVKVTPQIGFVDAVRATGEWYVSNHACAPLQEISGARREEIVHSPATVERQGDSYVVTALSDKFYQGDCKWIFMGLDVHLLKEGRGVGNAAANKPLLEKHDGQMKIVCDPDPGVPDCLEAEVAQRTFLKYAPKPGVFSFTIETM